MKSILRILILTVIVITQLQLIACANLCGGCGSSSCEPQTIEKGLNKEETIKDKSVNDIQTINKDTKKEEQLICLLNGPELIERKAKLQKEIFSQVSKIEEVEEGYVFSFKHSEEFILKLTDYIVAENKCCPFFTFETVLHSTDDITLTITGPQQAKDMIKMEIEKLN
jgi:hypothetical protein